MSKTKLILVFVLALILLALGFYRNQWRAAGKKWFYDWKTNSDLLIVGRLVESRQKGIFSDGGLLGFEDVAGTTTQEHQFDTYLQNGTFEKYLPYRSTTGAHGIIFSWIDQTTNFQPAFNLKLFRGITSVFSAAALALIVLWFLNEFGYLSALFVMIFVMLSEWLALYGGSIYWQLWSLYIPAIGIGVYLVKENQEPLRRYKLFTLVILLTILKCLFSGFEFITTSLLMMGIPVVYYSLARKWQAKTFFLMGMTVAFGALIGILISLAILSLQVTAATGDFQQAVQHISFSLGRRTVGSEFSELDAEGLKASLGSVLWKYIFEGRAINLANWINTSESVWLQNQLEIPYYKLFIVFTLFSVLFVIFARQHKRSLLFHKTLALFYTTWISLIPPLSWFIIFKAHSHIHVQLNYIIWQMPFTLFGFAFCGMVITYLLSLRTITPRLNPVSAKFAERSRNETL